MVPADAVLGAGGEIELDQSALTRESAAVCRAEAELVYQGSTVKRGEGQASVTATGHSLWHGRARAGSGSV